MIHSDMYSTIGKTPLIKLSKLSKELGVHIIAKTESRNPAGSVKDRMGYAMIDDAEKSGVLTKDMVIIEPTSGNTGIALAAIGASKGYQVQIVMPESMSMERRKIIAGLGAGLILTPAEGGMAGAIKKAGDLLIESPGKYYRPDQFSNPANPAIHILTTAPEIEIDTDYKVDMIVAGVGTGGTISGIGCYFKKMRNLSVKMVAVEPSASPIISQKLAGEDLKPGKHSLQGIGAGFIPANLDLSVIDQVEKVEDGEAIDMAERVMKEEGILCGISGGAALAGAVNAVKRADLKDINVVVILPDSGERYLSTALYGRAESAIRQMN